jgi:hypothetical protein
MVKKDEKFSKLKERLVSRLGMSEKEKEREVPKMKFFFVPGVQTSAKLRQLEDGL